VPRGLDEGGGETYEDDGTKDDAEKTQGDPTRTYENVGEGP